MKWFQNQKPLINSARFFYRADYMALRVSFSFSFFQVKQQKNFTVSKIIEMEFSSSQLQLDIFFSLICMLFYCRFYFFLLLFVLHSNLVAQCWICRDISCSKIQRNKSRIMLNIYWFFERIDNDKNHVKYL